ncbi:hypothetical protein [Maritimibacter dapengensis]|uniref:Uncharacterized protein n=1 Tax=Maritimibacter dapengensis TaxID=2836868 RepID=A0ABS6SZN9_9RHOB|nr:hypothetical protein [Maritimibacter dapengensis]MBV7378195.1 hypothetical protein [Maritimibacter dapengensis]
MVYTVNTTLRPIPKRVLRLGRIVFAILPGRDSKQRSRPRTLRQAVPDYLHRDVGLPPAAKASRLPPDVVGRTLM